MIFQQYNLNFPNPFSRIHQRCWELGIEKWFKTSLVFFFSPPATPVLNSWVMRPLTPQVTFLGYFSGLTVIKSFCITSQKLWVVELRCNASNILVVMKPPKVCLLWKNGRSALGARIGQSALGARMGQSALGARVG